MKRILVLIAAITVTFWSCEDDNDISNSLNPLEAPINLDLTYLITQDNSGLVTITPTAEGASEFEIQFGDIDGNTATLQPGSSADNVYSEGTYDVTLIAKTLNGLTSQITEQLAIAFREPENFIATIDNSGENPFMVTVTAVADYEAYFEFFPGEDPSETPIQFMETQTIDYIYATEGTFNARVVAYSGGAATVEYMEIVTISHPLLLPLDFEDPYQTYPFVSVNGATATNVANPVANPNNDTANVAEFVKPNGAASDAGVSIELDQTISFVGNSFLKINTWSPVSGITVRSRVETTDGSTFYEVDAVNTLASDWETMYFDFSAAPMADYTKVILYFDYGNTGNGTTYYFDNLETSAPPINAGIIGTWRVAAEPFSFGVGPFPGSIDWFHLNSAAAVNQWSCFLDDEYVFGADGSFMNVQQNNTWIEGWQGGNNSCGVPVAPHDGNTPATYIYNETANTLTVNGIGAYIGLPKVNNQGELPNVPVPTSITYDIEFIDVNTIRLNIEIGAGAGVFWTYKLVRDNPSNPLVGVWKMKSEAGAFGVGPNPGDTGWWSIDAGGVTQRACYFDDEYVFAADGTFVNSLGAETWLEGWQAGADLCGAPVAPHDGSNPATFDYNSGAGTITVTGLGAYIGLPKANNQGELPNVAVPNDITYMVTFDTDDEITVGIEAGAGVFWTYKLERI